MTSGSYLFILAVFTESGKDAGARGPQTPRNQFTRSCDGSSSCSQFAPETGGHYKLYRFLHMSSRLQESKIFQVTNEFPDCQAHEFSTLLNYYIAHMCVSIILPYSPALWKQRWKTDFTSSVSFLD